MIREIKNIAVLGAGLMGSGIAQVFATCDEFNVMLYDINEDSKPLKRISDNLNLMKNKNVITEEEISGILKRITFTTERNEAIKDADFVIECVFENMEIKQNLFREIEPICKPGTIFATNTSVMSITEIGSKVVDRSRVIGTHFWNPPFLIPLVEVVRTEETDDKVVDTTIFLLQKVNKHPIRVNKDVPGFVANRLQHALWREAISIVERGIADAATVDEAIKFGFGIRLPILGPMENIDMVGTDLTLNIHNYILQYLEDSHEPSKILKEKVETNKLGFKSGEGFFKWTPEQKENLNSKLIEYLIEATRGLK